MLNPTILHKLERKRRGIAYQNPVKAQRGQGIAIEPIILDFATTLVVALKGYMFGSVMFTVMFRIYEKKIYNHTFCALILI